MENSLDSQLWHACAGGMIQMPKVNSKVFYFPQGHAEHAQVTISFPKVPPLVPCKVASVKYLADPDTDEVYSKLSLVPVSYNEIEFDCDDPSSVIRESDTVEKPASFAKTLTQSDANNGGGFSVPRYCAETIFPRLDYSADPPVQTVIVKDVHDEIWKFRHIYRGTPRRHLLTTGWSSFINQKKLVAKDSIVFFRTSLGELRIGIRRAKRGLENVNGSTCAQSCWNASPRQFISPYSERSYSMHLNDSTNELLRNESTNGALMKTKGMVKVESVIETATLAAANGQSFEVVYYPRACTPEFFVSVSAVKAAMRIQWCPGMRFKMPFETEDSSRISWFMGTLSSVQVSDPIRWPNSPWRLLQVTWDEPDLLQNVNRVNPWLVELVSNMPPVMNISSYSSPTKKLCFSTLQPFLRDGKNSISSLSGNTLGPRSSLSCLTNNTSSSDIQGARHAQFGISLSDIHFNNLGMFQPSPRLLSSITSSNTKINENVSCILSIGSSSNHTNGKSKESKKQHLVLFGQAILTEQEISMKHSNSPVDSSREQNAGNEVCHVGKSLDLSMVHSYKELYLKLFEMFQIDEPDTLNRVIYHDAEGTIKHIGNEQFSDFKNSAKKLTVMVDPGKYHGSFMGLGKAENGLCSSKTTGALSIVA